MNIFRRYLTGLRRWLWLLVLGPIVAAGAAYAISSRQTPRYASSTRVIVGQTLQNSNPDYGSLVASERLVSTYAQIAQSRTTIEAVEQRLNVRDIASSAIITTRPVQETEFLDIAVEADDPQQAADIANAIAEQLILTSPAGPQSAEAKLLDEVNRQIATLNEEITRTDEEIKTLKAEIEQIGADKPAAESLIANLQLKQQSQNQNRQTLSTLYSTALGNRANSISVVESALVNPTPIAPRPIRSAILAGILGFALVFGLALLLEYFDDSVQTPDEGVDLVNAPLLAAIVKQETKVTKAAQRLVSRLDPRSPTAETFRTLRTNLQFSNVDTKARTLIVTSSQPEEGKSTVAANLAWVLAQAGQKVVLIDADLRKPMMHRVFEVSSEYGLTNLLTNNEDPTIRDRTVLPVAENLWLIPSGPLPPNPSELLGSKRMEMLIWLLQQEYDWILFDTPPILTVTDPIALIPRVDGVVLVAEAKRTRRDMLAKCRAAVQTVGGRLIGLVFNKLDARSEGYGVYYTYYYDQHHNANRGRRFWNRKDEHQPVPSMSEPAPLDLHDSTLERSESAYEMASHEQTK
ncbi:polysaccharide biosynthesis tyrosine autokinase [Herpetosiphon sp. NSE202]|uniref:polysaccharide biosynthesis tyrosine autokinase n=1 Tax=Herpetosiphon sp. NSE202 TaxID=3351349 RepID=UPI00362CD05B